MNINKAIITGNLTRDPELKALPSGTSVCELGVAVNHRRKDQSGSWVDEPNFFNVVVFGNQAEACANHLHKGRPVAVEGRLRWSSWEDKNGGGKRSKIEIVANVVQFLGSNPNAQNGGGGGGQQQQRPPQGQEANGVPTGDYGGFSDTPVGATGSDDDIPF